MLFCIKSPAESGGSAPPLLLLPVAAAPKPLPIGGREEGPLVALLLLLLPAGCPASVPPLDEFEKTATGAKAVLVVPAGKAGLLLLFVLSVLVLGLFSQFG
jgi:hypothetical protein